MNEPWTLKVRFRVICGTIWLVVRGDGETQRASRKKKKKNDVRGESGKEQGGSGLRRGPLVVFQGSHAKKRPLSFYFLCLSLSVRRPYSLHIPWITSLCLCCLCFMLLCWFVCLIERIQTNSAFPFPSLSPFIFQLQVEHVGLWTLNGYFFQGNHKPSQCELARVGIETSLVILSHILCMRSESGSRSMKAKVKTKHSKILSQICS